MTSLLSVWYKGRQKRSRSMNTPSQVVLLLAGIALYAGAYHLQYFLRTRDRRERLSFAVLCFIIVFYDVFSIRLYNSLSFAEAAEWQRMQVITLGIGTMAMLWFTSELIARRNRLVDWAFCTYFMVQTIIHALDRSDLSWTTHPSEKMLSIFGMFRTTILEVDPGPLVNIQSMLGMAAAIYVLVSIFRHARNAGNRTALPAAYGLLILIVAAANDVAVSGHVYEFSYMIEYGFTALVFAMSSALIAQHVATQRALTDSIERMRLLAAAIDEAAESVMITDAAGIITYVNPHFEKMTGYSRTEITGKTPAFLQSGVHDTAFYHELWKTLRSGQTWHGRFTNRRKDGRLFDEQAAISPVRDADGRIVSYVAVKRDVTQEVILGNQARESQKMAAIGKFAHRVVHDVTNKLVAILGHAQLARDIVRHIPQASQHMDEVIEAANRVSTMTAELLAFAHPAPLALRRLHLDRVVLGAEELLRQSIPENVHFTVDVSAASTCIVEVDPVQIEHVLLNLTLNAVEAMPKGGMLSIVAAPVLDRNGHPLLEAFPAINSAPLTHYGAITVTDTGEGISEESRPHIFEPFFTTRDRSGSPGLGLATVFRIVEQHRGTISVESKPGHGSSFRLCIPLVDGSREPATHAQQRHSTSVLKS